ncbi:MAG: SBBP repeat-containing protein [Chloroflexi bacterium]|nr:SBBP repeat-containing protein [Chloroflexota bacterium]
MRPSLSFRRLPLVALVGFLPLLASLPLPVAGSPASAIPAPTPVPPAPNRVQVSKGLASSGALFVENVGQFDPRARFQVRGLQGTAHLAEDGVWITVLAAGPNPPAPFPAREGGAPEGRGDSPPLAGEGSGERSGLPSPRRGGAGGEVTRGVHLKLSYTGANPHPRLEGFNRRDTVVSYFLGNDPKKWRPNVPVWGGVRYVDLFPGVDLEISGEGGRLAQRFVVRNTAAGAQGLAALPAALRQAHLRVEGATGLSLAEDGRLHVATQAGELRLDLAQVVAAGSPLPVGEGPGVRSVQGDTVSLPFTSVRPAAERVAAGASDLLYSTFLGGSDWDLGYGIAVDRTGSAYVTGSTSSTDFPTTAGAFDTSLNNSADTFVVKLNPTGTGLAYATFLGGSNDDSGAAIAVDAAGSAYVTGYTLSTDFPTTAGAFDTTFNGFYDAFVAKLSLTGSGLAYATLLGGSDDDRGAGIAVDGAGSAYIAGQTSSAAFPTTEGAFDTAFNGVYDAFVAKLHPTGSAWLTAPSWVEAATTGAMASRWTEPGLPMSRVAPSPPISPPPPAPWTPATTAPTTPLWPS